MRNPQSTSTSEPSRYRGRTIAVGTRHGKQHQFQPAFSAVLGAALHTPADLDTDRFGTFSGEPARTGSAIDAARAKARLAIAVTGLPFGLASEASYGRLPGDWFGHEELLLFIDAELGIEIMEGHRTLSVPGVTQQVHDIDEVHPALLDGLPDQALIVRPYRHGGPITKGITDTATLRAAISAAAAQSADAMAQVEPDLRAHHNPSRRLVLVRLADKLARRLATACPDCGAPGFGRVGAQPGRPCRVCATPTPLIGTEIHGCAACGHQSSRPVGDSADPADCPVCNP